jgi:hypothetical protein
MRTHLPYLHSSSIQNGKGPPASNGMPLILQEQNCPLELFVILEMNQLIQFLVKPRLSIQGTYVVGQILSPQSNVKLRLLLSNHFS